MSAPRSDRWTVSPRCVRKIDRDTSQLSFAAADLTSDDGWAAATAGCDYVLHVASPFPPQQPKNEDDLIKPAREGTLRVLRAAAATGVRRVVVTSSFAAIGYSPKPSGASYDESDWTDVTGQLSPYTKSKTLAERAAWEFAAQHPGGPELTVINPVGIFGPVLGGDYASSVGIIQMLLDGKPPLLPKASFAIVDVRDVADLHVTAMVSPRAAGERFLAAAGAATDAPGDRAHLAGPVGRRRHAGADARGARLAGSGGRQVRAFARNAGRAPGRAETHLHREGRQCAWLAAPSGC